MKLKVEYKIEPSVHRGKIAYQILKRKYSKFLLWTIKGSWKILREPEGKLIDRTQDSAVIRESIKFDRAEHAINYLTLLGATNIDHSLKNIQNNLTRIEDFPGVVILAGKQHTITRETLDTYINKFVANNQHLNSTFSEWLASLEKAHELVEDEK
jgi:hypothetical protein